MATEHKAPAQAEPKQIGTLSAIELSNLERRMQLEDPATIQMPGGGTFKDFLDAQAKRRTDDAAQKSREAEAARIAEQSPDLPDHVITQTAEGNLISAPVPGTEPKKEAEEPPAAKPLAAPAKQPA
jgi:hypothetical protein